jgi:hypothetical protein
MLFHDSRRKFTVVSPTFAGISPVGECPLYSRQHIPVLSPLANVLLAKVFLAKFRLPDLYTTVKALLNAHFKVSLYSLFFFSIFFSKRYNTGAIHPYTSYVIHLSTKLLCALSLLVGFFLIQRISSFDYYLCYLVSNEKNIGFIFLSLNQFYIN